MPGGVEQITAQHTLGTFKNKDGTTWQEFRKEFERKFVNEKALETQRLYSGSLDLFERICRPNLMRAIRSESVAEFRAGLRELRGKNEERRCRHYINKERLLDGHVDSMFVPQVVREGA